MKNKSSKVCFLFTQSYPYGKGEAFISGELKYLSAFFDRVVILPFGVGETHEALPANVSVVHLFGKKAPAKIPGMAEKCQAFLLATKEVLFGSNKLRHFRWDYSLMAQQIERADMLKDFIQQQGNENNVFYSYWFDTWALILSIVKKQYPSLKIEYCSRAHGFDIFRDQTRWGYHPFKSFMLKQASGVYSVSQKGAEYLKEQYPSYATKVHSNHLGSEDQGVSTLKKEIFHVVSCAGVRKVKRIELIPEILAALPSGFEVKWTLIGDGDMLEQVKEKCRNLKKNVSCEFKGNMENEAVMAFYRENSINLFLSTSTSEGIPFTMIEAISFGVPLMSTNVGGCAEICTTYTGILIDKDFNAKDVAAKIVAFAGSDMNHEGFRKGVRAFWENNFNAAKNYPGFYSEITATS